MSIERILKTPELVEEIAVRLKQSARAASLAPDRLRAAAEHVAQGRESTLSAIEEAIIRREGRPVFFVRGDRIAANVEGFWAPRIADARSRVEPLLPSVGRVELARHPKHGWVGTAWLVAPDVIVTNRHVVREFGGMHGGRFVLDVDPFNEPIGVSVDFRREYEASERRAFDVVRVLHVEEGPGRPDVALLKIERRGSRGDALGREIRLSESDPAPGTVIGVVGYAAWDGQRNAEDVMTQIFGGIYGVKRLHPGEVLGTSERNLTHDCSTLGGNSGSVVIDFATGRAVGLHYAGFYQSENFAVKASALAEILHRLKIVEGGAGPASPDPKPDDAAPRSKGSYRIEAASATALEQVLRGPLEGAVSATQSETELTPEQLRELVQLVGRAKMRLDDAAAEETDLGASPEDETAARLQSWLRENASQRARAQSLDGEVKFDERDLRWGTSLLSWLRGLKKHGQVRPTSRPETLPNTARIAILGDWGSGDYGAPLCGQTIGRSGYQLAVHLGDVYYAGTEREVLENFLRHWPLTTPGLTSRALNSNHEMYSGGYGYFDITLPAFRQDGSYFAVQNDHFLLLGLDTGYDDHDLDDEQTAWAEHVVSDAGDRKLILMSHHQLYMPGKPPAKNLVRRLSKLLVARRIFAWYWGHEHCAAIFEPHPRWGLHARCIGHGGFPYFRYKGDARVHEEREKSRWRALPATADVPAAKLLDDPNPYVAPKADPERYGAQGFASIDLDGPKLTERLHRPDGTVIYERVLGPG